MSYTQVPTSPIPQSSRSRAIPHSEPSLRRRRTRLSLLLTVALSSLLLALYHREARVSLSSVLDKGKGVVEGSWWEEQVERGSGTESGGTTEGTEAVSAQGVEGAMKLVVCPAEVVRRRHESLFWLVEETSPRRYSIFSNTTDSPFYSHCIAHAIFTARLLAPSLASPTTLFLLPSPPTLVPSTGAYEFEIFEALPIPRKDYALEVKLEFGNLEGARQGIVCGDGKEECRPEDAGALVGEDVGYSGKRVEVHSGAVVQLGTIDDVTTEPPPALCTDFSAFPGYWDNFHFYPTPSASPCSLLTPSLPPPFLPSSSSAANFTWISIIGDSNPRNLFSHLSSTFGTGPSKRYWESASATKNGTVASIALRSRTGTYVAGEEGIIVITWRWWNQPNSVSEALEAAAELVRWVDVPLSTFLATSGLALDLGPSKDVRATRTYVSMGSHAEELTALGMERSLDVLFGAGGLSHGVMERAGLRVFTTTAVQSGRIPLEKFPRQDLVRNNAVGRARNEVLRGRRELRGRVVEVGEMSEMVTEVYMKQGRPDAVHFRPEVYDEWARIVWTEMMREKEVRAVE